jgi:NAD(P)-dependent dehydrogenase (short-subunit alcohol dehydrogenase family)
MSSSTGLMSAEGGGRSDARGRLTDRKILVIGAGQQNYGIDDPPIGNGQAMSRLLAREGAALALVDRDAAALDETIRHVSAEGSPPVAIIADAADPVELERAVGEAHSGLGGLDGLLVNVGIAGGWNLQSTSVEDWDHVFQVNVRAHFLACKHALAVMPDYGSIVLTSSIAAFMPANEIVAYHSSKAALTGLCLWLAKHTAPRGIRVNLVVPGLIDTSLGRLASKADPTRAERPIPLGRQGTAWEVAHAAAFLLSGEASYITGHALLVDGGLTELR